MPRERPKKWQKDNNNNNNNNKKQNNIISVLGKKMIRNKIIKRYMKKIQTGVPIMAQQK